MYGVGFYCVALIYSFGCSSFEILYFALAKHVSCIVLLITNKPFEFV